MIFVRKSKESAAKFEKLVGELTNYEQLGGEQRTAIVNLLFSEQGHVCALCERSKRIGGTIEHFLPKSQFGEKYPVDLQLNYWNLYMACGPCNQAKGNELIPAYPFDPRFDQSDFSNFGNDHGGCKPKFILNDGKSSIIVHADSNPKSKPKTSNWSAMILGSTLELTDQNRDRLQKLRYAAFKELIRLFESNRVSDEAFIRQWKDIQAVAKDSSKELPEFATLILQLLETERKNRRMHIHNSRLQ